jgi:hypothetical protein
MGAQTLEGAGPSCMSCHRLAGTGTIGGGGFGPDLTLVHERLRGQRGLDAWLTNPPTPVMRAVYRKAPLNGDERVALAALFHQAATEGRDAPAASQLPFVGLGAGGAALALIVMGLVWPRRRRGVRRGLLDTSRAPLPGDRR